MTSEKGKGPRVVHEIGEEFGDAARAKLHKGYVEKFTANAVSAGLAPGSPECMRYVVTCLAEVNFSDDELRKFCSSHGYNFDEWFVRRDDASAGEPRKPPE